MTLPEEVVRVAVSVHNVKVITELAEGVEFCLFFELAVIITFTYNAREGLTHIEVFISFGNGLDVRSITQKIPEFLDEVERDGVHGADGGAVHLRCRTEISGIKNHLAGFLAKL